MQKHLNFNSFLKQGCKFFFGQLGAHDYLINAGARLFNFHHFSSHCILCLSISPVESTQYTYFIFHYIYVCSEIFIKLTYSSLVFIISLFILVTFSVQNLCRRLLHIALFAFVGQITKINTSGVNKVVLNVMLNNVDFCSYTFA